ncbi:hypothetical protein DFH27DRAFT_550089 [Peziza echinospora]|nr:hypothetical protein DFH27DRAFT_550089 [Peziza echinospora]
MGCVMSRSSISDSVPQRYSADSGHCEMRYSTSSSSCQYTPNTASSAALSPSLSGSSIAKPERSYFPNIVVPGHKTNHRFQHEQRKKPRVVVVSQKELKEMPATAEVSMKEYPMPPPPTAIPKAKTKTQSSESCKEKKQKKKKGGKRRSSVASEVKFEISWPTSCHRSPGVVPNAIALGYPYPYPFPLASVPSDPDLVSTASGADGPKKSPGISSGKDTTATPGGYFGYEYETAVTGGGNADSGVELGMVPMEIKPGRNPKWEGKSKGLGEVEGMAINLAVIEDQSGIALAR